jgi:L-threonylcarbamoyladenylate synthase
LSAEILRVHPDEPQPDRIDYIVSCLRKGDVVALPTDTFYGLAVDPVNLHAVEQIYQIKTRQKHKPLSLLIASVWPRPTSWRATPTRCWTSWRSASGPVR